MPPPPKAPPAKAAVGTPKAAPGAKPAAAPAARPGAAGAKPAAAGKAGKKDDDNGVTAEQERVLRTSIDHESKIREQIEALTGKVSPA